MQYPTFLLSLCLSLVAMVGCASDETFIYESTDNLTVVGGSQLELEFSLATAANEYLSDATIDTTFTITQEKGQQYDLLYFQNNNASGMACYQNWEVNNTMETEQLCFKIEDKQVDELPPCVNFTNCTSEQIEFKLSLVQQLYRNTHLVISNPPNSSTITLATTLRMELTSDNSWFYWGVGLTCLVLICLVIYAGIMFQWLLKYKKVKKIFEQFKLTEQEESVTIKRE